MMAIHFGQTALSCLCLFLLISERTSYGELFSALTHFKNLMSAENELASSLDEYITNEEKRLADMRRFADEVERALSLVDKSGGVEEYLGHPTNAYLLVRRFTSDWLDIEKEIEVSEQERAKEFLSSLDELSKSLPSEEDVSGTAAALLRLQDVYALNVTAIASGQAGTKGARLTLADCFYLGRAAYNDDNYAVAKGWFLEVRRRLKEGENDAEVRESDVVDHLAFCDYQLGHFHLAIRWTKRLLQLQPRHDRAWANLEIFKKEYFHQVKEKLAIERRRVKAGTGNATTEEKPAKQELPDDAWLRERDRYKYLCRTPTKAPAHMQPKLKCFYTNMGRNPRLVLRPAKVEISWINPTVVVYRDLISAKEIARLKELAGPKLARATVHSPITGKLEFANYRVSKSGWLSSHDDDQGIVERINQRIADVTKLNMATAEQLQVVNYGIGGQYEPHFDHAREDEPAFKGHEDGNRIATMLFYLSDVQAGGCTVFTKIGLRVKPRKGDASFWYNLLPNGKGDYQTRHAGCPVLSGSK